MKDCDKWEVKKITPAGDARITLTMEKIGFSAVNGVDDKKVTITSTLVARRKVSGIDTFQIKQQADVPCMGGESVRTRPDSSPDDE